MVESIAEDFAKAEGGNKAAGTLVRKSLQDIKKAAQEVRKKILEVLPNPAEPRPPGESTPPVCRPDQVCTPAGSFFSSQPSQGALSVYRRMADFYGCHALY